MKIHMEDNMTEYNAIISILTLGIILWFIGVDRNKDGIQFKIIGASCIMISIILNMLSGFNVI